MHKSPNPETRKPKAWRQILHLHQNLDSQAEFKPTTPYAIGKMLLWFFPPSSPSRGNLPPRLE